MLAPPAALRDLVDVFKACTLDVQPAAGHHPWFDDAAAFVELARNAFR